MDGVNDLTCDAVASVWGLFSLNGEMFKEHVKY